MEFYIFYIIQKMNRMMSFTFAIFLLLVSVSPAILIVDSVPTIIQIQSKQYLISFEQAPSVQPSTATPSIIQSSSLVGGANNLMGSTTQSQGTTNSILSINQINDYLNSHPYTYTTIKPTTSTTSTSSTSSTSSTPSSTTTTTPTPSGTSNSTPASSTGTSPIETPFVGLKNPNTPSK